MRNRRFPLCNQNKKLSAHRIIVTALIVSAIFTFAWIEDSAAKARKHPRLSLIGAPSTALDQTANNLENQGFRVSVNELPKQTDMILFVVSAKDGPMPQTREQISHYQGMKIPISAILLVDVDASTDPELSELVVIEMRELLAKYLMTGEDANRVGVLRADDPDLSNKIRGLL
jgi:hypothetical protein